jgi:hypothetical protein
MLRWIPQLLQLQQQLRVENGLRKNRTQVDSNADDTAEKINCDDPPEIAWFFGTVDPTFIACDRFSGTRRNHSRDKKDKPEDKVNELRVQK